MNDDQKRTPGPWFVKTTPEGRFGINSRDFYIAETIGGLGPTKTKANANLIAAAPDLLEALEALEAINAHWEAGNFSRQPHLWETMKAAIAKAKGGEK